MSFQITKSQASEMYTLAANASLSVSIQDVETGSESISQADLRNFLSNTKTYIYDLALDGQNDLARQTLDAAKGVANLGGFDAMSQVADLGPFDMGAGTIFTLEDGLSRGEYEFLIAADGNDEEFSQADIEAAKEKAAEYGSLDSIRVQTPDMAID